MKALRLLGSVVGVLAAALIGHHAKAAEGGLEWTQIKEDETRIVLYAPGLEGGVKRFYKAQTQAPYYITLEVGIWVGPSGRYPRAEIVVTDLLGDYHFDVKRDLKKETRELGMLKDKKVNFHEKGTSDNVIGQISYLRFTFESSECVSFSQYWGMTPHHDGFSEGTAKLVGYYCVGAAEGLSADTISAVLAGIGVKGEGVPERKAAKLDEVKTKTGEPTVKKVTSASGISRFDGEWQGLMRCASCDGCIGPLEKHVNIKIENGKFGIVPDTTYMGEGAIDNHGNMRILWKPEAYAWGTQSRRIFSFDGTYDGESFELRGNRGPRACSITLSRVISPEHLRKEGGEMR